MPNVSRKEPKELKQSSVMRKSPSQTGESPSRMIDGRIKELGDWRGKMLSQLRVLIKQADPKVVEEWKWGGPVWSHDGLICTGETYKNVVKMTFAKGAALEDPSGLFNSSLDGNTRRAIDFHEGEKFDEKALKAVIRAAAKLNASGARARSRRGATMKPKQPGKLKDGAQCRVTGGTHAGKSGTVRDIKTGKTGHVSITVVQPDGERFKTLAKNVVVQP
jgi:hypothetical protein